MNTEADTNKQEVVQEMPPYGLPTTRYVGSKRRHLRFIHSVTKSIISKDSVVLDLFGGSGSVSYYFKQQNCRVIYNDYLKFNWWIGKALIENNERQLAESDIKSLLEVKKSREYPTFIQDTFKDYYYTDEENRWLDVVCTNIRYLKKESKIAAAYYALFQACLIKRPWNLFNRINLAFRLSKQERNFGNKITWDTSFETMFRRFCDEINKVVFDNQHENIVMNKSVENLSQKSMILKPDIVYIDPPSGTNPEVLDYRKLYHFLEGITDYTHWNEKIDCSSSILSLEPQPNPWSNPNQLKDAWMKCIQSFKDATLVVSYRSPGYPNLEWIEKLLKSTKKEVQVFTQNGSSRIITTENQRPEMNEHILLAD